MLKKPTVLAILLSLALTACSAAASAQNEAPNNGKLNATSGLIIGTLKLDGTAQAVTKDQATQLMTLWQVYKQLMTSDTAAQAEIDGLSKQIRETMTSDQLKAIDQMNLSQSDMLSYVQQPGGAGANGPAQGNGGSANRSSRSSGSSGSSGSASGGAMPGGMPPGGMPPGGDFGGMPPGAGATTRQGSGTQTANASPSARMNNDRVPAMLIDTLIQYLQKIAGTAPTPKP